jgi:WD40 repeat protein
LGIDWHPSKENQIVTGAFDKKAIVWDLNGNLSQHNVLKPVVVYEHSSGVEDVKWFKKDENLIAIATQ